MSTTSTSTARVPSDAFPEPDTLDRLVAASVRRHPDRPALRHQGQVWTYRELWRRSDGWVAALEAARVGPDDLVAVCLGRTPDLVAALVGVHRAGAAYVPLDPQYPRDRIDYILNDSGAAVVLCEQQTAHVVGDGSAIRADALADRAVAPHADSMSVSEGLAYVIYTSGSTGLPKGVAIEHRQAVALAGWAGTEYSAAEWEGVLFSTSICFDLSVFEMFATLANGGTVVVADNALELPTLPDAHHVRLVNTVPSAMAVLTRQGDVPPSVHTVNLAGEPLTRALADAVYAVGGVRRVLNLYGPSEDTTYSTWVEVPRSSTEEPTIGGPLPGTRAYVLDSDGARVADGDIGELYLAGAGVARGYLGRPDLTAERFLPDPYVPGDRMYRTGDLVQLGDDGELRYRGRTDHQVKIRGHRIELGEIEATLVRHRDVSAAVVVVRDDPAGNPSLVAFVEAPDTAGDGNDDRARLAGELRAATRASLPGFMVPSAVHVMAGLPLTPNGKVDRQALPDVALAPVAPVSGRRAATGTETLVAAAWAGALGLTVEPPVDAAWADLGGNSLLAASVLHRLARDTGRRLRLAQFPAGATIRDLAVTFDDAATDAGEDAPVAGPGGTGHRYRIAPCQSEFFVLDEVTGGGVSVIPSLVRVDATLDLALLRRALDLLPTRHEVLRTRIAPGPGGLTATIAPALPTPMTIVPSTGALLARAADGIDLGSGQLLEVVVRDPSAADEIAPTGTTLLLLRVHHAASDGWSTRLLVRDLGEVYAALAAGREPAKAPELQFADCADWLAEARDRADDRLRAYWAERLRGVAGEAALAPTRPPTKRSPGRPGSMVLRTLDRELVGRLDEFAREERVTAYAAILATTAIRVQRESGVDDMAFRVPVSNRRHPLFEDVVGPFLETALTRVDVSGDPTFAELVARITRESAAELDHSWADSDAMYSQVRPTRDGEGRPIGQTLVAVQNYRAAEHTADGITWTCLYETTNGGAKTDLGFFWELNRATGPALDIEYDTELHSAAGVAGYADQILRLLDHALEDPHRPISALPWTSAGDEAVIAAYNEREPLQAAGTTSQHVLDQATRTPDAVAVRCPQHGDVTYRRLVGRARRLAERLAERLAADDRGGREPVAVACRRGADGIAAMLAAWWVGRPYLPLDTAHPSGRLEAILADSGAVALIADDTCPDLTSSGIPEISPAGDLGPDHGDLDVDVRRVTAADSAYLIYTSGSTGRPKGVRISHGALSSFLEAMDEIVPLRAGDVITNVTTPSFDIAGLEMWLPLRTGAAIGVVDEDTARDGFALARRIAEVDATVVQMTPSGWSLLLETDEPIPPVRALIGAEPVPPTVAAALVGQVHELWNVYGPTEATIWSCAHRIGVEDTLGTTVPVGRPLGNTRVYVLDEAGQLAPVGAPGWIHLAGTSLADGYHGLDELTAAAFRLGEHVPGRPRIYRTGDRGILRADGVLECLGRGDNQVKVRGVRIELDEIDTALRAVPGVRRATSRVQPDGPAAGHLVGYVVPDGDAVTADVLRARLAEHLPAAMVPTLWVFPDELPLNAAGKIDRRALPAPEPALDGDPGPGADELLGELEAFLAEVWVAHLPVDRVPARASFFELGGHSLAATRMIGQLRSELGVDLAVRTLFHHPTLRDFTAAVEAELVLADEAAPIADDLSAGDPAPVR